MTITKPNDTEDWADEKAARLFNPPVVAGIPVLIGIEKAVAQALRDATRTERERCAKVAEDFWLEDSDGEHAECAVTIAAAIRNTHE